jgi:CHAT domain-containing protein
VLPSCAARPVTVAPSAAMWLSARAVTAAPASPGRRVVAAAGPGLSGARTEAAAVARTYGSGTLMLAGEEATVTSVIAALRGSDVAHLAAHGRLRVDNPLFSALEFADGPLTVYDLEQLDALPHTVVLASCESVKSAQWAGDELIGLAATFLSRRTAQLIGSVVPVPDAETVPLMVALHRSLADGLPAAEALAGAQRSLLDPHSPSYAAAAGFVCVGAGLALPHPRSSGRDSHGLGELSVPRQVPVQQDRRPMSAGRRAEHAGE